MSPNALSLESTNSLALSVAALTNAESNVGPSTSLPIVFKYAKN
jgi:hypothetical protein